METQSKVLKWSVIMGIVIVLNLFFNYTLSLVYKSPDYNVFCPSSQVVNIPETQEACVLEGGQWTNNAYYYDKFTAPSEVQPKGYCDLQYTCRADYESASSNYNRNIFVALVLLGALSVLAGNFFQSNAVVSNGLALGGVLSFIIASMRYWSAANDFIRVVILAIALGLLIWVAMKKFKNQN